MTYSFQQFTISAQSFYFGGAQLYTQLNYNNNNKKTFKRKRWEFSSFIFLIIKTINDNEFISGWVECLLIWYDSLSNPVLRLLQVIQIGTPILEAEPLKYFFTSVYRLRPLDLCFFLYPCVEMYGPEIQTFFSTINFIRSPFRLPYLQSPYLTS